MSIKQNEQPVSNTEESVFRIAGIGIMATVFGLVAAVVVIPIFLPGLVYSVNGEEPKAFWFLSRGTALVSFVFLWISMVLGLLISAKVAKFFPGAFTANDLHQFVSIGGLVTGLIHGLLMLGDKYMDTNLFQILAPFTFVKYRPVWVGVGQLCFYFWLVTVISFYIKKRIGYKAWRTTHYLSFLTFAGMLVHGILSGTDTGTPWVNWMYWISAGSILFLTLYRVLAASESKVNKSEVTAPNPRPIRPSLDNS